MKRFFALASLVLVMASCSNSGDTAGDIKDSVDSTTNEKLESIDAAAQQAKDTIKEASDSLKNRIDSVTEKATDSLNQNKK